MTTIRMRETRTGSPDGRYACRYREGQTYTTTTLEPPLPDLLPGDPAILSEDLARVFLAQGWAEVVEPEPEPESTPATTAEPEPEPEPTEDDAQDGEPADDKPSEEPEPTDVVETPEDHPEPVERKVTTRKRG